MNKLKNTSIIVFTVLFSQLMLEPAYFMRL